MSTIDLDALVAAAAPTEVPAVTVVRTSKPNPFGPIIETLNANRGTATAIPFDGDDKARAAVSRLIRDAALDAGVSARIKHEADAHRLVVWVIDRVTRQPRKAKAAKADDSASK